MSAHECEFRWKKNLGYFKCSCGKTADVDNEIVLSDEYINTLDLITAKQIIRKCRHKMLDLNIEIQDLYYGDDN